MGRISKYAAATAPQAADVLVIVQGGVTKKITYAQIRSGVLGDMDALVYKGAIACAGSPNYPAAEAGHAYKISSAGRIGGGSGPVVAVGDMAICAADGTPAGTQSDVGANWNILQGNLDLQPATAENDLLFGGPAPFGWVKKTLAEAKAIFGIGASVPAPTAVNDVIMATGSPLDWAKKSIAELKTALGLGTAAYTASSAYDAAGTATSAAAPKADKAANLSDLANPATAFSTIKQAATTDATGVVELATDAEALAGTSSAVVLTPANLAAKYGVYAIHEVTEFPDDHTSALAAVASITPAADKLAYFTGAAAAAVADFTAAGRALVDDASASAQRTTLGLAIGVDVAAYEAWTITEISESGE